MPLIVLVIFFFTPIFAHASSRIIFSAPPSVSLGDQFSVTVSLDTEGVAINALSGTIRLESGLSAKIVSHTDGLIPLWIESPKISNDTGSISFAGIIPGGFAGNRVLMDIVVSANSVGDKKFSIEGIEARVNDQNATTISMNTDPASVNVVQGNGTSTISLSDTIPPESFQISISNDPTLFDGSPFAVFGCSRKSGRAFPTSDPGIRVSRCKRKRRC